MAAGLTLAPGRVEELSCAFEAAVTAIADAEVFERELLTDGPLSPAELSLAAERSIPRSGVKALRHRCSPVGFASSSSA